ncbi:inner centromere protein [Botrytis cinerea]
MTAMRPNKRLPVGSKGWIEEERSNALELAATEAEEFTFAARNEIDWLNEHMAEIFNKNQVNVAEIFKTPGKLRGKTPRTARKLNQLEVRAPLSDVFSATPQGAPSPFRQAHHERSPPKFRVAEDAPAEPQEQPTQPQPTPSRPTPSHRPSSSGTAHSSVQRKSFINALDSGYYGSQLEEATQPNTQPTEPAPFATTPPRPLTPREDTIDSEGNEDIASNAGSIEDEEGTPEDKKAPVEEIPVTDLESEEKRTVEVSFQSARERSPIAATIEVEAQTETGTEAQQIEAVKQDREPKNEDQIMGEVEYPNLELQPHDQSSVHSSPEKRPQHKSPSGSPSKAQSPSKEPSAEPQSSPFARQDDRQDEDEQMDDIPDAQSASDGSSPIRPIFRKSSLNFASLPARDLSKKSLGHRTSRTSHYGRPTGGKSLGNVKEDLANKNEDEMDVDEGVESTGREESEAETLLARIHNKTSTQRLQDQISKLGQSQPTTRPASKSLVGGIIPSRQSIQATQPPTPQHKEKASPPSKDKSFATQEKSIFSPRPTISKNHTADVMESVRGKETVSGSEFNVPDNEDEGKQTSPIRDTNVRGLTKSISTSFISSPKRAAGSQSPNKLISVSNPNLPINAIDEDSTTPPKSPPRTLRGSPLKVAKDKFSSILKSGKTLFASSAAASAEAKIETLSSSTRIYQNNVPSFEDVLQNENNDAEVSYPKMDMRFNDSFPNRIQSPVKATTRKTRASTEKEEKRKEEAAREAREAKEAREAQKMNDQLEKARMKVKEDARVYHQEQERAAAMQRELISRKEQEKQAKTSQVEAPKTTRSSPRRTKAQLEAEAIASTASSANTSSGKDTDMTDAPASMPPPSIPRPKSQIGRPQAKRPLRPVKDAAPKAKAPATVIRVDTGSSRGQQYHPSNTTLAATLEQSLQSSQGGHLRNKASSKAAARKKEADELAAQQRRDAKLEMERQRAATKEEQRRQNELTIKRDQERQREQQKEISLSEANKRAIERAKQKRAPPPAIRPQQKYRSMARKIIATTARMNTAKAPPKRPLLENNEEVARPPVQRNAPSNHGDPRTKRQRTNEYLDEEDELTESHPKMTAPPIRQSSIRPKEMPTKSLFASGYAHAPPPANLQRSTIVSQHQNKIGNPMDMTQVSKGAIPFASSSNGQSYKTPARNQKSSPRYENGENIVLPEIPSDSEDDDDEDDEKEKKAFQGLGWTDSPEIRKQLALQETIDPSKIFGRPQALNMEEVFDKSKDRFHKFRARTSSANWSGSDRLTEEEVRKDLEGRDRVRRQGGWSYDPSF